VNAVVTHGHCSHLSLTSARHQVLLVPAGVPLWLDCYILHVLMCHVQFEVLDVLQAEVEEAAQLRAAKAARSANARRQSVSGGGAPPAAAGLLSPSKGAAPPRSRSDGGAAGVGLPPRPSSACSNVGSPGVRRADGPATPMPLRGVSSRSLSERHSICVVR
jgi:hypothetical protein